MKRLVVLMGLVVLAGCSKDSDVPNNSQADVDKEKPIKELLTENEKAFLKNSIDEEISTIPTLSSGDTDSIELTKYFPVYSADQVTNDYAQNEIKANNLYKSKYFFINGKISGIEAGIDEKPIVRLNTKANYGFNSPMLRFNKVEYSNVAELSKGSKATFFCVGKSEIAGSPVLNDCLFLETFKTNILNEAQNFEDQNIAGEKKLLQKVIYNYISTTLFVGQLSNDFQKCKIEDIECINKLAKGISKEEIDKYKEVIKAKLPEATKTIDS